MKKGSFIQVFFLLVISLSAFSYADESPADTQTIVFGANNDEHTYVGKLAILVYNEAFKRLKMNYEIKIFPLKRLDMSTLSGLVDGDIARTAIWGEKRSDLIRIEEPLMYFSF